MRNIFILCNRVVGLVITTGSILTVFLGIVLFVFGPYVLRDLSVSMSDKSLAKLMGQQNVAELQAEMSRVSRVIAQRYAGIFLLIGIGSGILGIYLMYSGNIFIKRCYPDADMVSSKKDIELVPEQIFDQKQGAAAKSDDDKKYAPDGYYS